MYTNDDLQNLSEEEKKKQKHSIEMQVVILESDQRKVVAEKNMLEAELRKLKMDEERLRIVLEGKKERMQKVTYEISQNEEELKRLRKKLNFVR